MFILPNTSFIQIWLGSRKPIRGQDMGSKKKKFRFVYLLCFSKMGFGTLADNFIALRIMTIKKSKVSIIRWGGLTSRHFFGGEEH